MAIISIKEGWRDVQAGGETNARTAVRVFSIVTDAASRGVFTWPQTVGAQTIPVAGSEHPDDEALISREPQVTLVSPSFFLVAVPYSTEPYYANPLDVPWDFEWDVAITTEPIDIDPDGHALANSIGEPFDPPLSEEFRDAVLRITRNQATWDPDTALAYEGTVSAGEFWGAPMGRARMANIRPVYVRGTVDYWRVTYEIHFRWKGPVGVGYVLNDQDAWEQVDAGDEHAWYRRLLNQGRKYKAGDGKTYDTQNGELIALNIDGSKWEEGSAKTWLLYKRYPFVDWGALLLDYETVIENWG